MDRNNWKALCPCTRVIEHDDQCFVQPENPSRFFCKDCGQTGCRSSAFKGVCFCGKILFIWSQRIVCPQTSKILCFDCGQPKIKAANIQNSIDRRKHQKINFRYLKGFDDSLTWVGLSGWHLFVQCITKLHQSDSLTHYELIKKLAPEWKALSKRTRGKFKWASEQVKSKIWDQDLAIKNMCCNHVTMLKKIMI
jgi:hypothetical protein